jgi:hypothetical protein
MLIKQPGARQQPRAGFDAEHKIDALRAAR